MDIARGCNVTLPYTGSLRPSISSPLRRPLSPSKSSFVVRRDYFSRPHWVFLSVSSRFLFLQSLTVSFYKSMCMSASSPRHRSLQNPPFLPLSLSCRRPNRRSGYFFWFDLLLLLNLYPHGASICIAVSYGLSFLLIFLGGRSLR